MSTITSWYLWFGRRFIYEGAYRSTCIITIIITVPLRLGGEEKNTDMVSHSAVSGILVENATTYTGACILHPLVYFM